MAQSNPRKRTAAMAGLDHKSTQFKACLAEYLSTQNFSDFTVTCGYKEWRLHRIILSAQSEFFEKACGGPFIESTTQKLELKGDQPFIVDCMFQYFYKKEYVETGIETGIDRKPWGPLAVNDLVYAMADKYLVDNLRDYAVSMTLALLKKNEYSDGDFFDSVKTAWNTTLASDGGLRVLYVGKFMQERSTYLKVPYLRYLRTAVPRDFLIDLLTVDTEPLPSTTEGNHPMLLKRSVCCDDCSAKTSLKCRKCRGGQARIDYHIEE